jgi:hypothetical protein
MTGAEIARRGNGTALTRQTQNLDSMQVAEAFARSGMFPDVKSQAQALVKIVAGEEMGIGPMAAMMGINIIQGKVTLSANLLAAQVKAAADYDYLVREHTAEVCRIEFFQRTESVGFSEFSMADAQRAGVAGGQNYRKYPKAMLFARALTQGVRWYCPDVTAGSPAYVPEELGAQVDQEGEPVVVGAEQGPPVEEAPEPPADAIDAERVERICAGIKALQMPYKAINLALGAAGLDALRANSAKALTETIEALTPEQADAFEAELEKEAERDV